ncbi:MAG: outer membrane lipoprotein-sorting protein [Paraglaciecola sp.]|jgi:outer membrane lipoprotein-sorting protein
MKALPTILLTLLASTVQANQTSGSGNDKNVITQTARLQGYEIAQAADLSNTGWVDLTADLQMKLQNSYGTSSERLLKIKILEVQGNETGDKSLVQFETPANLKGTVLLTHAHAIKSDNQWQFFPSLKRVKRISSANKSGPFMGSQFAYEDMSGWLLDKYSYALLGEEELQGIASYQLQMEPKYAQSGYTRLVTWLSKEHFYPMKTEFYDRKGALLKTLIYGDYHSYHNGRFWRAGEMMMNNHVTKKTTLLNWSNYRLNTALNSLAFEKGSLTHL